MKKTILLSLFVILLAGANTFAQLQTISWYNWNDGYKKAKEQDKLLLVDVYTDWCGWCKKMDKDTYLNPEIIGMINKDFIPVKFNPELTNITYVVETEKYNGFQLLGQLTQNQRTGYPTTVILYPKKKMLMGVIPGYKDAISFKPILQNAVTQKPAE